MHRRWRKCPPHWVARDKRPACPLPWDTAKGDDRNRGRAELQPYVASACSALLRRPSSLNRALSGSHFASRAAIEETNRIAMSMSWSWAPCLPSTAASSATGERLQQRRSGAQIIRNLRERRRTAAGTCGQAWANPVGFHQRHNIADPLLLVAASDCQSPRRHVDRPEKLTPHRPSAVQATTPQALNAPPQSDVIADRRNWRAFDQRVSIRHVADFNGNACLAGLQPGGEVKTCPRRAATVCDVPLANEICQRSDLSHER